MTLAVVVGLAGGVGAVLRYLVDGAVQDRVSGTFPCGTLTINVGGSLILGFLVGMVWYHGLAGDLRLVLGTGLCGGFTTWSTASWESVRLFQDRLYRLALVYTVGGLALALVAAAAGVTLAATL
ncbi:MAG TPA: fluoride efflux transporter CrcB [Acidimicrobiales bacterium]|nr:fluoride efflux transporter CrcB [Acidimicrobiales bacterium]